jgi:hypothetical protein
MRPDEWTAVETPELVMILVEVSLMWRYCQGSRPCGRRDDGSRHDYGDQGRRCPDAGSAGALVILYGAAHVGTGMFDPIDAKRVSVVTIAEGVVLLALSRVIPHPSLRD